ncbi:MAG: M20/M25/M40 family metallo-hydrolase [Oscillospiraceae bacterium]|nr:M20/M25/M40 family metallo-hydrolase [Oscillospiraceae bacterium]
MDVKETLFALSRAAGPVGFESAAAQKAKELLEPLADEVRIDRLGNVLAWVRSKKAGDKPVVLLDAHLDEVGIMVTGEKDGFYTFSTMGGIDPRILPACEFCLLTDPVTPAIVACLPPHVLKPGDSDKTQKTEDLFLDTGGVPVEVGTPGVFAREPVSMGSLVSGKAFDDRACFVAILRALEHIDREAMNVDLVVCGSAQEEAGGRGALTAAYGVMPDMAVIVDVTHGSTPDSPALGTYKPGSGVCVNKGPDCNRTLTQTLIEIAKAKDVPHQIEVSCGMSGTNATEFQNSREGICTAVLSIPLRYMHTPAEALNIEDIESCAKLIGLWVMTL